MTTKSIILQEDCATCVSTQAMFLQLGTGIVYPLMGAIGGTYMVNILRVYFMIIVMVFAFFNR